MKLRLSYKAILLLLPAICTFTALFARQGNDTVCVYFPFNESKLPVKQQEILDSLSYNDILTPDKDLMIVGYADFPGTNDYNDALSKKRAAAVFAYLKTLGFKQPNIELCVGKGELEHAASDTGKGYAPDRRVDIVILSKKKKTAPPQQPVAKPVPPSAPPVAVNDVPKPAAGREKTDISHLISSRNATVARPAVVLKDLTGIATMQPGATILLDKIFFPSGRHFIARFSEPQLEELYQVLNSNPDLRVRIEGHVCCIYDYVLDAFDEDDETYLLSVHRARFIYEYLIHRGIAPSRLEYVGFGHSRPVVLHEQNEDDAQQNRRVEIRVLSH
ncbi:OmpA family protein [Chitinophagaceae bacterium MMS25-I14]